MSPKKNSSMQNNIIIIIIRNAVKKKKVGLNTHGARLCFVVCAVHEFQSLISAL